ncbi:hypothetical protein [Bombella sp. ESL0385]|uniref:hypothetical protein n=1 Tax=Bombella sp. ESL0385 TaxID=2676446 RepID=UPI0012D97938|nr:hypothetical protein [Bombella sp. ESL0385]MUG90134.1 hypothetical protein [Bombella sp. ESL0385]
MVKLGPNSYPQWRRGSVPSVEEWQLLFSQKLDSDRVMEELSSAINTASPQQIAALVSVLLPVLTGPINNEVIPSALNNYATVSELQEEKSALQSALQQETQRAQTAENSFVSGTLLNGIPYQNDFTVSSAGVNKSSGTPWLYSTGGGGTINLALQSALQQETQRAQAAEAELLPLTGGQMRGEITTSIGGIVPQVIGMNGNIVMQVWNMQIPSSAGWYFVTFPQAYMPGSVPFVFFSVDYEQNTGHNVARIVNTDANTFSNKGISVFVEDNGYQGTSSNGATYKLNCLAIGTMT